MDSYFKGALDEILIYNRALKENEIIRIYGRTAEGESNEAADDQAE